MRCPSGSRSTVARLADANVAVTSLIGMGYTGTITPPVIARNVLENPAWYTAYTPYQPEISQGRLEAILNFQTVVTELTGLDVANASLLDEGTAAAEAMTMARRLSKSASPSFFVHADVHPQTLAVLRTRAEPIGIDLVVGDAAQFDERVGAGLFGALFSFPTSTGAVIDWTEAIARVHDVGGLAVVATDPLACVLATPPGELGADIAIGSAQRFGVPMGFGGPHAAFLTARDSAARRCPAASSGSAPTPRDAPRCDSPCRRVSSTSGGRRRRRTSARRRCCWPTSPVCTRRGTARRGCGGSPRGCTGSPRWRPPGSVVVD